MMSLHFHISTSCLTADLKFTNYKNTSSSKHFTKTQHKKIKNKTDNKRMLSSGIMQRVRDTETLSHKWNFSIKFLPLGLQEPHGRGGRTVVESQT